MNKKWLSGKNVKFWNEVDGCKLLLQRLNDDDIESHLARLSIMQIDSDKLLACQKLYEAWSYYKLFAEESLEMGYRLDEFWVYRMEAVNKHILDRCVEKLSSEEQEAFELSILPIFQQVKNSKKPTCQVGNVRVQKKQMMRAA